MSEILYLLAKQQKFQQVQNSERLYRKELIYVGDFQKDGEEFALNAADFQNWKLNFEKGKENGIQVFLQLEHNESPENTRGELTQLEMGKNEDGIDSLYGYFQFRDEEAEKLAASAQVSVYVVSDFTDGKGNEYTGGVIRHVALTQAPVVPALEKFEIAASFVSKKGTSNMIKTLARELGIEGIGDDTDETVAFSKVLAHFNTLAAALEDMKKGGGEKKEEEEDPEKKEEGSGDNPFKKKEEEDPEKKKDPMAASFISRFSKQEAKTRSLQIERLMQQGKITKAAADDLKKDFCEEKSLALSFDSENDGSFKDGFDKTVSVLEKNDKVLSFHESTGDQKYTDQDNPLIRDAEQRSKS